MKEMDDIIKELKAHAIANYETNGWDVLVETWSDKEIAIELQDHGITTFRAALEHFKQIMKIHNDYRSDIMNA